MEMFKEKYGPWAIITGASYGLGAEFARQCAAQGLNTILIARTKNLLDKQKKSIEQEFRTSVLTVTMDLSTENFLEELIPITKDLHIGLLINNAGISSISPFIKQEPDFLLKQFYTNARASLILARHYGELMVKKSRGGIIFLSSASSRNGTAYVANYAGTKAYNQILGESLWYEMKEYGVDVLGFMPGSTGTPGWDQHNPKKSAKVKVMKAEDAVKEALHALGKKPAWMAGRINRFAYFLMGRIFSRKYAIKAVSQTMEDIFQEPLGKNKIS